MMARILKRLHRIDTRPIVWVAVLSAFFAFTYVAYINLTSIGVDWVEYFRPAAQLLLHGHSPYRESGFYNAPWVLLPMLPIALLPVSLGNAFMYSLNIFAYLYVAHKLRMNPLMMVFFVLFSGMQGAALNGNIEGLLALGFILPPQIGLFFLLAKPQFGIGMAVFIGVMAWRENGLGHAVKMFLPVTIAFLLSFLMFGFWPYSIQSLGEVWWNTGIFPYGIPIGLGLLALAVFGREKRFAISSSPFFAPYLTAHTWAVVWLGILSLFEMRNNAKKA